MINTKKSERNTKVQGYILPIYFCTESREENTVGINVLNLGDPGTNLISKTDYTL